MGELQRLLPAVVRLNDEPTISESTQSASPTPSDKTVAAPQVSSNGDIKQQPQPGRRAAIFSTDLGRRAPRGSQQPGLFQPIARSNLEQDAYLAAGRLRKKYPYQYLSIFPHQDWNISDLWDDYDIQTEGEDYFTAVLGVIANHNAIQVPRFAREYADKHPERLNLIGGNTAGIYDKIDPLSVVDKIFVNGETREYPPRFLWNVAHVLRTNMLAVKALKGPPKGPVGTPARSGADQKDSVMHSTEYAPASVTALANASVTTSTVSNSLAMPNTQAVSSQYQEGHFACATVSTPSHGLFDPPAGSVGAFGFIGPVGPITPVFPAHHAGGPDTTRAGVYVPRTRPGRSASCSQSQTLPTSPYVENMPRIPSGYGPRQHVGPVSATQSPRFHPTHMAMNYPMANVPPNMMPFGYDQGPTGPGAMAAQPYPTGIMHRGAMPHHAMQGPPMMQTFLRQPPNVQGSPFTVPMGDMTNVHYGGPLGMPMQNADPRRRLSQQHTNSNALYDPYEGNNPTFRTSGYAHGKKYNQSVMHNTNGRPRKPSFPSNRPYHGQNANVRPQTGTFYNSGPKSHMGNDPSITQDRDYGCFVDWIGPLNEIVNELFVKGLPEDVREAELEGLFQARLGVKLTSVNIRCSPQAPQRMHAFIGFPTCAIAKQALVIPNPLIRGCPVSITVPKRFFQKTVDVPSRDTIETGPSAYCRYTSNSNNREVGNCASSTQEDTGATSTTTATKGRTSYSPQDARSDLPKRKRGNQTQQMQVTAGSPKARKTKPRIQIAESSRQEESAVSAATVKANDVDDSTKAEGPVSASMAFEPTMSTITNEKTPTIVEKEDVKSDGTEVIVSKPDAVDSVSKTGPSNILPAVSARSIEPSVDQAMTSPPQPGKTTATKVSVAASTPLEVQDSASEDELRNEASFHSAAQSLSGLEALGVPKIGSDAANHGIDVRVPEASIATSISTPVPPDLVSHSAPKAVNGRAEEVAAITRMGSSQSKQESKTTIMAPSTSGEAEAQPATQLETKTPTKLTLVVGQTRKRGPEQPEAYFPSHKQLAKQAKKEREKKKKAEKKKDKLGKQRKGEDKTTSDQASPVDTSEEKAEIAFSKTDALNDEGKPADDIQSVVTTTAPAATTSGNKEISAITEKSTLATTAQQKAVENNCSTSGKSKDKTVVMLAAKTPASTEDTDKDHGKQTNGTSVTPETSSVTNKDVKAKSKEAMQEMRIKESIQESAPDTGAQSSKQDARREITSGDRGSNSAGAGIGGSTPSGKKKKNKNRKKKVTLTEGEGEASKQPLAWPNLDFHPKSPNPAWMGPIDMESDVHNYENIMDEACGGQDDSDFSWTDLPTMEDVLNSDKDEGPVNLAGGSGPPPSANADKEVALAGVSDNASHASSDREDLVNRGIAALASQIAAKQEQIKMTDAITAANGKQPAEVANGHGPSDSTLPDTKPPKKKKANKHKNKKKKRVVDDGESSQSGNAVTITVTASTPPKATADVVDPSDPFARQLKHVDAVIDLNQNEAAASGSVSLRKDGVTPTEEPTLKRAMEAYFREAHPERRSKGRKASQQDLQ